MRRLFWQMMVSLDGYMSGPRGELDWHIIDEDFRRYAQDMLRGLDGMLLGRVTYDLFADYWPGAADAEAPLLNALPKYVFSRGTPKLGWNGARLMEGDALAAVERLKRAPGRELALFGSANLAASLLRARLIDELRFFIAPLALGSGRPAFSEALQLSLIDARPLASGVVLLRYRP